MTDKPEITIDFQKSLKPILKNIFLLNGCLMFCSIPLFVFIIFETWGDSPVFSIILFVSVIIVFIVAKKYYSNALYREFMILNAETLTIANQIGNGEVRKKAFEINLIEKLAFVGGVEYTEHPLQNNIIDITGFGTTEKEVQFLIDEGTMEIVTANEKFRFGKNIPSWEAQRIISIVKDYLGERIDTELAY